MKKHYEKMNYGLATEHVDILYGTLKECVDELYGMIDFDYNVFPEVIYSACTPEDAETALDANKNASGWFGIVNCNKEFATDSVVLLFGHFGGGGIESLELTGEDPEKEKEMIMQRIASSTIDCGYGALEPNDYTVFEF